jgi:glycosyltransferase involved in cell wall biosynthesis
VFDIIIEQVLRNDSAPYKISNFRPEKMSSLTNGKPDFSAFINNPNLVKDPKISVVIPVYMEEKILEKVLSVYTKELREKYKLEIIVSDGGSSDKSVEIAKKHADKLFVHSEDRRQTISEGRNRGAELAESDCIIFINGDTIPVEPENFFNRVLNWHLGDGGMSESIALACPVTVEEDQILFKDKVFYALHNSYVRFLNFIGIGMGRGECQIVKTAAFRDVGGYNSSIAAGEDFDLYQRMSKIGKVSYASKIKVYESPRRFRKFGYLRILKQWTMNSLSMMYRGRSVSDEWVAVR